MSNVDIRWLQRLQSFRNALARLTEAVDLRQQRSLSNLEKQGFVKAFEFTHEQAWNLIKDYFTYQGNTQITGSRDATREAFKNNLITEGDVWMEMIQTRNKAVHVYDEAIVNDVIKKTSDHYYTLFVTFQSVMQRLSEND
jgi:nucleotidyltransferase substrate binding protein (TIGR01987 family)